MGWMKLLVGESLPLCNVTDEQQWDAVLDALERYAYANGAVGVEFGPYQSNCPRGCVAARDYDIRTYYEFPIALGPDEDTLMANLSTERRRNIRKAEKAGLTIEQGSTRDDLLILDALQSQTKERASQRGDDFPGYQEAYLDAHESALAGDAASLFIARKDGEPISAALITHFNKRSYYFFGGTSQAGYKCGASPFVLWNALLASKARGFREFNLGGVRGDMRDKDSPFFGLYRFKRGYGAEELPSLDAKKTLRTLHSKVYYGTKRVAKLLQPT